MTDPREQQGEEGDDLDLDAETVQDLDAESEAEDVQGGRAKMCSGGCPTASDCP